MKITAIRQQQRASDRYSVYVDGAYAFSVSEHLLVAQGLHSGQELTSEQVAELRKLSADDKLYVAAMRYVAARSRSVYEMRQYLLRKQASPPLVDIILNKLSQIGLLDDARYAQAYVHDRQLLRPTSLQKLRFELRKKGIADDVIEQATAAVRDDTTALQALIARKRQQSRYQDSEKLMAYLARQGFRYDDIKNAL